MCSLDLSSSSSSSSSSSPRCLLLDPFSSDPDLRAELARRSDDIADQMMGTAVLAMEEEGKVKKKKRIFLGATRPDNDFDTIFTHSCKQLCVQLIYAFYARYVRERRKKVITQYTRHALNMSGRVLHFISM